jgi:hypothetical protein
MTNKMVFLVASAWEAAVIASALPLSPLESDSGVDQVRMVCDEYGSCWRESSPAEDITRGVIEGLEGRSIYRQRGWDHPSAPPALPREAPNTKRLVRSRP